MKFRYKSSDGTKLIKSPKHVKDWALELAITAAKSAKAISDLEKRGLYPSLHQQEIANYDMAQMIDVCSKFID